jgi:hypothetical protein
MSTNATIARIETANGEVSSVASPRIFRVAVQMAKFRRAQWSMCAPGSREHGMLVCARLSTDRILDFAFSVVDACFGVKDVRCPHHSLDGRELSRAAGDDSGSGCDILPRSICRDGALRHRGLADEELVAILYQNPFVSM